MRLTLGLLGWLNDTPKDKSLNLLMIMTWIWICRLVPALGGLGEAAYRSLQNNSKSKN